MTPRSAYSVVLIEARGTSSCSIVSHGSSVLFRAARRVVEPVDHDYGEPRSSAKRQLGDGCPGQTALPAERLHGAPLAHRHSSGFEHPAPGRQQPVRAQMGVGLVEVAPGQARAIASSGRRVRL